MGHHVVPQLPFVLRCGVKVDVIDVGLELGELLWRYCEPQFGFSLGQRHP